MKQSVLLLAFCLACSLAVHARMGDDLARSLTRYGSQIAGTGQRGELTSTRTFQRDGIIITCGYVGGTVEMITYIRNDHRFDSAEIEAFLRTNGRKSNWTPSNAFTDGTYHCVNGETAVVAGKKIKFTTPKWDQALAKDQAAEKAAATAQAAQGAASSGGPNPNYTPVFNTNAASYEEPAATTNAPSSP